MNLFRKFGCYKSSILTLLLWNMLVGCAVSLTDFVPVYGYLKEKSFDTLGVLGSFILLGVMQVLYPIAGLVTDVHFGRYNVIVSSSLLVWCGYVLIGIAGIYFAVISKNGGIANVVGDTAILVFIIGFSGFKSNSVQFSLDQLLDASSEEISVFLHWFVWSEHVGVMMLRLLVAPMLCSPSLQYKLAGFSSIIFLTLSTLLVFLLYLTRNSFYRERVSSSTYRNVWRVLRFAVKHDKPLRPPTAFSYAGDEKPTRIDFAKRRFGGHFDTETVEDVKTFLRIFLMLFTITFVFLLDMPALNLFPLFGLHLSRHISLSATCSYQWILFESGNLSAIISVLAVPLYLLLVYPFIKKWIPGIIFRLGIGIALMVLSIISMFVIQALANYTANHDAGMTNNMFIFGQLSPS